MMDLHSVMDILKLKMPLTIIITGEIIFLILFILYRFDWIDLETLVTSVVVVMVAWFLGHHSNKRSEARQIERDEERIQNEKLDRERKKKYITLENWIETHNTDLINNVFKHWYGHKYLFNWYDLIEQNVTEFKEFLQNIFGIEDTEIVEIKRGDPKTVWVFFNETFLSLYLNRDNTKVSIEICEGKTEVFNSKEENGKLNIYEINSINGKKESLALEHLKGSSLWKLRKEISTIQDNISICEKAINEYILIDLEQSASLNFTRGCSSNEDSIVMFIYNTVKDFSNTGEVPDNYKLYPQINFNKNNKELIEHHENFRKQIGIIIKDKNLNEMIGKVVNYKVLVTKKTNEFEQGVEELVYDFENKHSPLNGTCKDCEGWHEKLQSLK